VASTIGNSDWNRILNLIWHLQWRRHAESCLVIKHDADTHCDSFSSREKKYIGVCDLQVYTYVLRPLAAGGLARISHTPKRQAAAGAPHSSGSSSTPTAAAAAAAAAAAGSCRGSGTAGSCNSGAAAAAQQVVGYELQLVMEYCPLVSYECYMSVTCMLLIYRSD
jgi:hypothetical protein